MGKESKKKRDARNRANNQKKNKKPCIKCGEHGAHFVPPSLGDDGFFSCQVKTKEIDPEFKRELEVVLPKITDAERYAIENFRSTDEGDLVHIRRGCFNGNGLNETICFGNIEDAYNAGANTVKAHYNKQISETLEDLLWAQDTLRSKLKFGLDEEQAVYRRETRCKGVFLTAIRELQELIKPKELRDAQISEYSENN